MHTSDATQAASPGRWTVGKSGSYDSWTVVELKVRARELGLIGYSGLNKSDLISELRDH
jgi:hypothetical protein